MKFKIISNLEKYSNHLKSNLTECDCYYELNDFERNMLKLSQKSATLKENYHQIQWAKKNYQKISPKNQTLELYEAQRPKLFKERFNTVCTNFEETIGKLAGNCLPSKQKVFDKIQEKYMKVEEKAATSSWKVMVERNECDAASVLNLEIKEKHIKDAYRSYQLNKCIAQVYLKSSWKDFEFIEALMTNPVLSNATQNKKNFLTIQVKFCSFNNFFSLTFFYVYAHIYLGCS